MKKLRILALLAVLAVLLVGCVPKTTFEVTVDGKQFVVDIEKDTISDGTHTYHYVTTAASGSNVERHNLTLTYPNGSTYECKWSVYRGEITNESFLAGKGYDQIAYTPGPTLYRVYRAANEQYQSQRFIDWRCLGLGIAMSGAGVFGLCFPYAAWELRVFLSRWRYRDADPSDDGLFAARIGHGLALILGIILVLIGIFK